MNGLYVILLLSSAVGYTGFQNVDPGLQAHGHVQPWHGAIPALSPATDLEGSQVVDRVPQYQPATPCVDANTLELGQAMTEGHIDLQVAIAVIKRLQIVL